MAQPIIGTPPTTYGWAYVPAGTTVHLKNAVGERHQVDVWSTVAGRAGTNLTAGRPLEPWEHREVFVSDEAALNINGTKPFYADLERP